MSSILDLESQSKNTQADKNGSVVGLSNAINEKLEHVISIAKRSALVRGVSYVTASVLISVLAFVAIDGLISIESHWVRWLCLFGLVVQIIVATWYFIIRSAPTKNDLLNAAWKIEEACPELEERLLSTVQLLDQARRNAGGSSQLIDALANETAAGMDRVNVEEINEKSNGYPLTIATIALCLTMSAIMIWPGAVFESIGNLLAPWTTAPVPQLAVVVNPGSISVATGQSVLIDVHFKEAVEKPMLEFVDEQGDMTGEIGLSLNADGAAYELENLQESVGYRIRDGKKCSPNFLITVLPKPVIKSVDCELAFPSYTAIQNQTIRQVVEPIIAPPGTKVTLSIPTESQTTKGYLKLGDGNRLQSIDESLGLNQEAKDFICSWEFEIAPDMNTVALLQLESDKGIASDPYRLEIRAENDVVPEVKIISPGIRRLNLSREIDLPVAYSVTDDFGVSNVELFIQYPGQDAVSTQCPTVSADPENPGTYLGRTELSLSDVLADIGYITFWVVAHDNRDDANGGPQFVESDKTTIVFEQEAESFGKQQIEAEFEVVKEAIEQSLKQLEIAKAKAEKLESHIAKNDQPASPGSASELRSETKLAKETVAEAGEKIESETELFKSIGEQLEEISKQELVKANIEANQIPLTDDPTEQQEYATNSIEQLDNAMEKMDELLSKAEENKRDLENAAELDELARQQEKLAEQAKQAASDKDTNQSAKDNKVWNENQEKLADKIQQKVDDDPDAKREQILEHADQAEQLSKKAEQLANEQQKLAELPDEMPGQKRDRDDLKKQLGEIIANEQKAVKEQAAEMQKQMAQKDGEQPEENRLKEAENAMDQTIKELDKNKKNDAAANEKQNGQDQEIADQQKDDQLKKAAENARKALDKLQGKPAPEKPNGKNRKNDKAENQVLNGEDAAAAKNEEQAKPNQKIERQQKNIAEALDALANDDVENAKQKMQQQIADRAEQLKQDVEKLGQRPNPTEEIKEKKDDAIKKLEQAQRAADDAKQQMNTEKSNSGENGKKQPSRENQKKQNETNQNAKNKQGERSGGQKQPDEKKQKQSEKGNNEKQLKDAKQNQGNDGSEKDQKQCESKSNQRDQQDAAGQKQKQAKNGAKNDDKKQGQGKKQNAQQSQKKAAESLKEASKSLQQVCESCRECKECQSPGGNGGSKAGNSKKAGQPSQNDSGKSQSKKQNADKPGQESTAEKNASQSKKSQGKKSENGQGDQPSKPSTEKSLAKAADKSSEAANSDNPDEAARSSEQAANALNKAADEAAKKSGYKLRNAGQCNGQCDNPGDKPGDKPSDKLGNTKGKKDSGSEQSKSNNPSKGTKPGSNPKGVENKPGDTKIDGGVLRGGSTSNWTRSRKQHKGGVLDDRSGNVPEEYRGIVNDYFKELARRGNAGNDSKDDANDSKNKPKTEKNR